MGNADSREGRTSFGERMFQARSRLGLTQMQVCEELGIMHGTIFLLETSAASSRRTVEFARLYRCDQHWLSTGEGSPGWDEQDDAVAQEDIERDALRALRALPLEQRLRIAVDVIAQAEKHRVAAPEPQGLEPAAEAPQQTEAQRAK